MNTQNYEKNLVSYSKVVNAGRLNRQLEMIAKDLDFIAERLIDLLPDDVLPKSLKVLHSEIWSVQLKYKKHYDELFNAHLEQLKGE